MRLRGRLDGRRVVPYYDRAQIEQGQRAVGGQGTRSGSTTRSKCSSCRSRARDASSLDDGETVRVGYADQNGHPYRSIGRFLVERGELPLEQASMQGIKAWARAESGKVPALLN